MNNNEMKQNRIELSSEYQREELAKLLQNVIDDQGLFRDYKRDPLAENGQTSPDRPLQIAILRDFAAKLHQQIDDQPEQNTEPTLDYLKIFIGIVAIIYKMAQSDEDFVDGWIKRRSRLKIIVENLTNKMREVFGAHQFDDFQALCVEYLVEKQDAIFNESYKNFIFDKLKINKDKLNATWFKLINTISTFNLQICEESSPKSFPVSHFKQNKSDEDLKLTIDKTEKIEHFLSLLKASIEVESSYTARFANLTDLLPDIEALCKTLHDLIAQPEKSRNEDEIIFEYLIQLNLELVKSFGLVVNEALKAFFLKKKLVSKCLQIMMHCFTKIILYTFEQRLQVHSGIWYGLNQCFEIAYQHKLNNGTLTIPYTWHNQLLTLNEIYGNCLLLHLINPYEFNFEDLRTIRFAVEKWAKYLRISKVENPNIGEYIIDLKEDRPPTLFEGQALSGTQFAIDIQGVIDRLTQLIIDSPRALNYHDVKAYPDPESLLNINLLKQIKDNIKSLPSREHSQTVSHKAQHVRVSLGIEASQSLLPANLSVHFNNPQARTLIQALNENVEMVEEIELYNLEDPISKNSKHNLQQIYVCDLLEYHESGFILKWLNEVPPNLVCGEILALNEAAVEYLKTTVVGVIHTIKKSEDATILTVKILADDAIAIKGRMTEKSPFLPLVLSFKTQNIENAPSIFAPALPFKEWQEVQLEVNSKIITVGIEELISSSKYFQQFKLDLHGKTIIDFNSKVD